MTYALCLDKKAEETPVMSVCPVQSFLGKFLTWFHCK